jgi:hypothetical protein
MWKTDGQRQNNPGRCNTPIRTFFQLCLHSFDVGSPVKWASKNGVSCTLSFTSDFYRWDGMEVAGGLWRWKKTRNSRWSDALTQIISILHLRLDYLYCRPHSAETQILHFSNRIVKLAGLTIYLYISAFSIKRIDRMKRWLFKTQSPPINKEELMEGLHGGRHSLMASQERGSARGCWDIRNTVR